MEALAQWCMGAVGGAGRPVPPSWGGREPMLQVGAQGGPCALSPHGASLHHVNENRSGDCDISSP